MSGKTQVITLLQKNNEGTDRSSCGEHSINFVPYLRRTFSGCQEYAIDKVSWPQAE